MGDYKMTTNGDKAYSNVLKLKESIKKTSSPLMIKRYTNEVMNILNELNECKKELDKK